MPTQTPPPPEFPERFKKTEVLKIPTEIMHPPEKRGEKGKYFSGLLIGAAVGCVLFLVTRPLFDRKTQSPAAPAAVPAKPKPEPVAPPTPGPSPSPVVAPAVPPPPVAVAPPAPVATVPPAAPAASPPPRATPASDRDWLAECARAASATARRACFERALDARSDMLEVRLALLSLLGQDSDWKKAGLVCTETLAVDSDSGRDPRLLAVCADVDRHLLRCDSGLYKANKAIGIEPRSAQAYLSRARLYAQCLDRCEAAVLDYREYHALDPQGAEAGAAAGEMRRCLRAGGAQASRR